MWKNKQEERRKRDEKKYERSRRKDETIPHSPLHTLGRPLPIPLRRLPKQLKLLKLNF